MEDSILKGVKKLLGLADDYTAFDFDVIIHVNSALGTLHQLGIGPTDGFMIEDDTATWTDFLDADPRLSAVKSYVYLKTRILFDPPTTGYLVDAVNQAIKEAEWRLNVVRENDIPVGEG